MIFWGTFFPLISEAVTGTKSSVGPPWFDRYTVPLALALVLLSGIGPVIAWRRVTIGGMWRDPATAAGRGGGGAGAHRRLHERRHRSALARHVRLGGVRARGGGAGVLARGKRACVGVQRAAAGCRGQARGTQPAPLRRLPRARGDCDPVHRRGGLVGLRAPEGRAPVGGAERQGRTATRSRTARPPRASSAIAPARARPSPWAPCSTSARARSTSCSTRRATSTRPRTPRRGRSGASSPARPTATSRCAGAWAAPFGPRSSPTSASSTGRSRWPTRSSATANPNVQGVVIDAITQSYLNNPPPALFRMIVVAVRRLDLDRRSAWHRRRPDRPVALSGGAAAARHEPLRGPPRSRALARLGAPPAWS